MKNKIKMGKVFIVGAGPGDPGLITMKGIVCIKKADVILYDYLASSMLLKHARHDAELIYVGKKGGDNNISQDAINEILVDKAKKGKVVTRLKGGDPFVFGRGGEEVEALAASQIKFEIVPGVTSAIAAPAYAGIPLTHRRYTSDVTFVTGHEDPMKQSSCINWQSLGMGVGTLVFFMAIKNLANIVYQLKKNGRSGDTPAAIIRWGTTAKQTTVTGSLDTIESECRNANIKAPAMVVIGQVVNLKRTMNWFENRPLAGKSIVITRARAQASNLLEKLFELGANCIECPTIEVIKPTSWELVDKVIDNIAQYDWLILTSVNSVDFFFERLFKKGKDVRVFGNIKTAVIGPATSNKLLKFGIKSDIIPKSYCAESIIEAFSKENVVGKRICLPRATEARVLLPSELLKMGARVDEVPVYRTIKSSAGFDRLISELEGEKIDMITFTSSSTVKNFRNMLLEKQLGLSFIKDCAVASIGPITAKTASDLGFEVDVIAEHYTIDGLCKSIVNYYS